MSGEDAVKSTKAKLSDMEATLAEGGPKEKALQAAVTSWEDFEKMCTYEVDLVNGPNNAHANLRLFGKDEKLVRVVLYRDNHAWCPYCQKVWLFLEEKKIPYRIQKVTMFCYGQKESWYTSIVPSGMLPALTLNGETLTESDDILEALEKEFGILGRSITDREVMKFRQMERQLFRAWCTWLCFPVQRQVDDDVNCENFKRILASIDRALTKHEGPFYLPEYSVADVVMTPYIERMCGSLFYYKGFNVRDPAFPAVEKWFDAIDERPAYRGSQSDFHTNVHDLPPQMGGCYTSPKPTEQTLTNQNAVKKGSWFDLPEIRADHTPDVAKQEALSRILLHRENVVKVNPCEKKDDIDIALRCAVNHMMTGESPEPPPGTGKYLRFIRDRVNVPRDMGIFAAKYFRTSLEATASLSGLEESETMSTDFRRDQDPIHFLKTKAES